jgi:hypothetical protein
MSELTMIRRNRLGTLRCDGPNGEPRSASTSTSRDLNPQERLFTASVERPRTSLFLPG